MEFWWSRWSGFYARRRPRGACYRPRVAWWWGLLSWLGAGLALSLAARPLAPWRRLPLLATLAVGVAGGVAGGALATVLGFGGLAGFDPRSLATAALAALLALLVLGLAAPRAAATPPR